MPPTTKWLLAEEVDPFEPLACRFAEQSDGVGNNPSFTFCSSPSVILNAQSFGGAMPTTSHPPKAPNASNQPLSSRVLRSGAQTQPCPSVSLSELSEAVRNLCDQSADSTNSKAVLFAVCLIVIEDMMSGQPTGVRQVWATKLYQLADALAAEGDAPQT